MVVFLEIGYPILAVYSLLLSLSNAEWVKDAWLAPASATITLQIT
jgi:hypothetical protein